MKPVPNADLDPSPLNLNASSLVYHTNPTPLNPYTRTFLSRQQQHSPHSRSPTTARSLEQTNLLKAQIRKTVFQQLHNLFKGSLPTATCAALEVLGQTAQAGEVLDG